MSIVTKGGDSGTTGLMFNRRVPKTHPQVEACGAVDELNAALGLARAASRDAAFTGRLLPIQKMLVTLMGELSVAAEDRQRYRREGFPSVDTRLTSHLDQWISELEAQGVSFGDWAMPGGNSVSAALDLARTVCRRAERRACALGDSGQLENAEVIVFLNRLSDLLWLLARREDGKDSNKL